MKKQTYMVVLDSAYNNFRIVEAHTGTEARRMVERTNDLPVRKVYRR